ncbi:copper chaperone PCu(A)C [Thioclava litoralis]|uniref:Copper chaperone PCu(A)C n=1 Tax=Thioclava litoralis TaxID=3076557 RepID=A0ABZ1DV98_9RHOB|nr:copper chaperone PCu(A)C [Thioclava sp. FTW29]
MIRSMLLAATATLAFGLPAFADGILIHDAYMRVSSPVAKSGAAFMTIENQSDTADQLVAAHSDIADRTELHTHKEAADGMMQMLAVPEGFAIPAQGTHALARGGDHIMFMGLKAPLKEGDHVQVVLDFKNADPVTVDMKVTMGEAGMDHSAMHGQSAMQGQNAMQGMSHSGMNHMSQGN